MATLRSQIHPEAVRLYDEIVHSYYPGTHYPKEGAEWAIDSHFRRREEDQKFRQFMGWIAISAGRSTTKHNPFSGWSAEEAVAAANDPELRRLAWVEIERAATARKSPAGVERTLQRDRRRLRFQLILVLGVAFLVAGAVFAPAPVFNVLAFAGIIVGGFALAADKFQNPNWRP